ncbi:carbohydrate kinase family protein [Peribacillus loiseleuriae]|uniref:Carbohydrate kinase PfkB domain-containing protein n=1 Tax=Peribacillus loiseleuriae TaxID=1679170 RepID=A0A0K9GWE3_9BACI|nr:carbohydrate kinase [Peribacillus loiseleuriae]KMY50975.1 hypothetical protein AC625_16760 [Peribacillus loiseleuriae]
MYDVVSLGELLIDLIPNEDYTPNHFCYEAKIGGAPVNVLSGLAKWGHSTAYMAKVGNDSFGRYIKQKLENGKIHSENVVIDRTAPTTIAVVSLDQNRERTFDFIRNPGADQLLTNKEVNYELIKQAKIFHFGSLSLTHNPSREATLEALKFSKKHNKIISFDPNYRPLLWSSKEEAYELMAEALKWADIVKIAAEELQFMTNESNLLKAVDRLIDTYDIPLVFVTKGKDGAFVKCKEYLLEEQGYKVNAIDTTGAGDAFMASILHQYLLRGKSIHQLNREDLLDMLTFANDMASKSTTQKGGFGIVPALV